MSILQAAQRVVAPRPKSATPYACGDRIVAVSPEGVRFLFKVEVVSPTATGQFNVLGAIVEPRRYRGHVLSTVVAADGTGPAVRAA